MGSCPARGRGGAQDLTSEPCPQPPRHVLPHLPGTLLPVWELTLPFGGAQLITSGLP